MTQLSTGSIIPKIDKDDLEVYNISGSSAGAGSGEFHTYRNARRKEMARLKKMDEEFTKEQLDEKWKKEREERIAREEEQTRKKAEKRKAKKMKQKHNKIRKKFQEDLSQEIQKGGLKLSEEAKKLLLGSGNAQEEKKD
mmetsp:Transcript_45243/g.113883  ORF Transcript_45243/g.113883 Transcript_45243/m.113883 type:complete len:139 (-) Transcript_45243:171-587(-)